LWYRNLLPTLAPTTYSLPLNAQVEQAIAYAWTWQALPDVQTGTFTGTPTEVLHFLISALRHRGGETYGMGIYQRGFTAGPENTHCLVAVKGYYPSPSCSSNANLSSTPTS